MYQNIVTTDCDYCGEIRNCVSDGSGGKGCHQCLSEMIEPSSFVELSRAEKAERLEAGRYVCEVPPVPHALWTEDGWITWIDSNGYWL